jgi:shikimate dehydrogenase
MSSVSTVQRFAVVGHPISHSRSPDIHAAFAAQTGIALIYERVQAPLDAFAATLQALHRQGFTGCNVTLPFKAEALALAQDPSPRATLAGAANTLAWHDGRLWADNTDGLGLVADIERNGQWPLAGKRLLLLGAGGASAGCLGPLIESRPRSIRLWNRSPSKAEGLVQRHGALAAAHKVDVQVLSELQGEHDAVINGTSAALGGAALSLPAGLLAKNGLALDMVYGPPAEPFLAWAQQQGAGLLRDGLGMLVEQAAEAFGLWHGVRPKTQAVLQALRKP